MAEPGRMTAAQVVDKLMSSEHVDVVRESVAWLVAELIEAEVAGRGEADLGGCPGEFDGLQKQAACRVNASASGSPLDPRIHR